MEVIAYIHNDFKSKFGIPRQSGRAQEVKSTIIFEPAFRQKEAFRGLEEFSHIWLIWKFSETAEREGWSATVRPPRLGGNVRKGVFATRSPFRPNPIGLSSVRLEKLEFHPEYGPVLYVSGADLMDNTPIYDIKPYLPGTDCHPRAVGGFADRFLDYRLTVVFPEEQKAKLPPEKVKALTAVLQEDPRPAYQNDPERIYGMSFGKWNIRFRVEENVLTVTEVQS